MTWQSPSYLAWVRRQPCMFPGCGRIGGEAHHIRGVGHFGGGALKAPDILAIAICREHHAMIHATSDQALLYQQYSMVWRTLKLSAECGVLTFDPHHFRPFVYMELGKMHNPAPVEEGMYSAMWKDWLSGLVTMCDDGCVSVHSKKRA